MRELVWLAVDDDELSADERRLLDQHLAGCADCRQRVAESRRVAAGLSSLAAPGAPARFKEATLARLEERPIVRPSWGLRSLAAAAAIVLLASIWWANEQRGTASAPASGAADELASAPKVTAPEEKHLAEGGVAAPLAQQDAPPPPAADAEEMLDRLESDGDESRRVQAGQEVLEEQDAREARDGFAHGFLDDERKGEAEPAPLAEVVATAAGPTEALQAVLDRAGRLDSVWREKAPGELAKDAATKEPAPEERAQTTKRGARLGAADSKAEAEPPPTDFLVVRADSAPLAEWLRALPAAQRERDLVVVDATPQQLEALVESLRKTPAPAERLDAEAWLERVNPPTAGVGQSKLEAEAKKSDDRADAPPSAPTASTAPASTAARSGSKSAPTTIRIVLWLEPSSGVKR